MEMEKTNQQNEAAETAEEQGAQTLLAERPAQTLKKNSHPLGAVLKGRTDGFLKPGDIAEGILLEKKGNRVFVDLQTCGTGIIYGREYYAAQDLLKNLNAGDAITAKVVETDNEEGFVELSLKEAGAEKTWLDLKKAMEEGEALELAPNEANRGGLIIEFKGIKGFLPVSQLAAKNYPRVEGGDKEKIFEALQKFVGKPMQVKILDIDPRQNKLIFTERKHNEEEIRSLLQKYKTGDEVEGEIAGVVDFGAFLKFNENLPEGLIHISEIDWSMVEDPRKTLKTGDKIKAKIIDIQGDKVSFSLKRLKEDPWLAAADKYKKGDVISGKITKFNSFGAFVEVADGLQGLIHISEFGSEAKMKEELELGKERDFKIALFEPKERRMSLTVKISETQEPAAEIHPEESAEKESPAGDGEKQDS